LFGYSSQELLRFSRFLNNIWDGEGTPESLMKEILILAYNKGNIKDS
jgi:hypothetical protein